MFNSYRDTAGCYGDQNVPTFQQSMVDGGKVGPGTGAALPWGIHPTGPHPPHLSHSAAHPPHPPHPAHGSHPNYHSAFHHHSGNSTVDAYSTYSMPQAPPKDQDGKDRMRSSPANAPASSTGNSWQNNRARYPGSGSASGAFLPYPAQLGSFDGQLIEPSHVAHGHSHSRKAVWASAGPGDSAYPQIVSQPYQRDTSMSYAENHRSDVTSSIIRHTTSVSAMEVSQRGASSQSHQQPPMHQQQTMHPSQQHSAPHHELFNQLIQKEREAHRLPGYQETVRHTVVRGQLPSYHEQIYSQHQHQQYCNPQDILRKPLLPTGGGDNEHRSAFTARQRSGYGHSWNKGSVPYLPFHHSQILPSHRNASSAFQPCSKLADPDVYSADGVMWSKSGQVEQFSHSHLHQVHSGQAAWLQDPSHLFTSQQSGKHNFHAHSNVSVPPNMLNLDTGQVDPPSSASAARAGNTQSMAASERGNLHPMSFQSTIPPPQQHMQHLQMQMHQHMYHHQQQAHQQKQSQSQLHQGQQQQMMHQQSPHPNPQPSPLMNSQSPHTSMHSPQQPNPCAQQHLEQQSHMHSIASDEELPKSDNSNSLRSCIDVRQFLETWNEDTDLATPRPACATESELLEASETAESTVEHPEEGASLVVLDCRSLQREEAANLLNMYPSVQINGVHEGGGLLTCSDESLYGTSTNTVVMETTGVLQNLLESGCGSSSRSSSASVASPITSPSGGNSARSLDILLSNALPTPPASQEQHMTGMQTSMPLSTPVNIIGMNNSSLPHVIEPIPQPSMDSSGFGLLSPTSPEMPSVVQKPPGVENVANDEALTSSTHDVPIVASCTLETVQESQANDMQSQNKDMQGQNGICTNLSEEAPEGRAVSVILSPVFCQKETPAPLDQDEVHFHSQTVLTPKSDFSKGVLSIDMCDVAPSPALSDTSMDGRKTSSLRAFRKRKLLSPDRPGEMQDSLDSHSHDAIDAPTKIMRLSPGTPDIDLQPTQVRPSVLSPVDRSKWAFAQIHENNELFKSSASSKTVNVTDILKSGQSWELSDSANSGTCREDKIQEPSKKTREESIEKSSGADSALSLKYDKCTSPRVYLSNKDTQTDESRQYSQSKGTSDDCENDLVRDVQDKACQKTIDINNTAESDAIEIPVECKRIEVEEREVNLVHIPSLEEVIPVPVNRRSSCDEMVMEGKDVTCIGKCDDVESEMSSNLKQRNEDINSESTLPIHASCITSLPIEESKGTSTSTLEDPASVAKSETGAKYLSRIVNSSPGKIPKILLSRLRDVREKSRRENGIVKRLPSIKLMRINSPCGSGADPEYVCSGSSSDEVTDCVSSTTKDISISQEKEQPVPTESSNELLSREKEESVLLMHEPEDMSKVPVIGVGGQTENRPDYNTAHTEALSVIRNIRTQVRSTYNQTVSPPHSITNLGKPPVSPLECDCAPLQMRNENSYLEQECINDRCNQNSSFENQSMPEVYESEEHVNVGIVDGKSLPSIDEGPTDLDENVEQITNTQEVLTSSHEQQKGSQHNEELSTEVQCSLNVTETDVELGDSHKDIEDCRTGEAREYSETTCNGSRCREDDICMAAVDGEQKSCVVDGNENGVIRGMPTTFDQHVQGDVDLEKQVTFSEGEKYAPSTAIVSESKLSSSSSEETLKTKFESEKSEMGIVSTEEHLLAEECRSAVYPSEQSLSPPSISEQVRGEHVFECESSSSCSNSGVVDLSLKAPSSENPVSHHFPVETGSNNCEMTEENHARIMVEESVVSEQQNVHTEIDVAEDHRNCHEGSSCEEIKAGTVLETSGKSDSLFKPNFLETVENTSVSSGITANETSDFSSECHPPGPEEHNRGVILQYASNDSEPNKKLEEHFDGESGIGSIDSHHREDDNVCVLPESCHSPTHDVDSSDQQDQSESGGLTVPYDLSLPDKGCGESASPLICDTSNVEKASNFTSCPLISVDSTRTECHQLSDRSVENDGSLPADQNLLPLEEKLSSVDTQHSSSQEKPCIRYFHQSTSLEEPSQSPYQERTTPVDLHHSPSSEEHTSVDCHCSGYSEKTSVIASHSSLSPENPLSADSNSGSAKETSSLDLYHSPHPEKTAISSHHSLSAKELSSEVSDRSPCHENTTVTESHYSPYAEESSSLDAHHSPDHEHACLMNHQSSSAEEPSLLDAHHSPDHEHACLMNHQSSSAEEPSSLDTHHSPDHEHACLMDHQSSSAEESLSLDLHSSPHHEETALMESHDLLRVKESPLVDSCCSPFNRETAATVLQESPNSPSAEEPKSSLVDCSSSHSCCMPHPEKSTPVDTCPCHSPNYKETTPSHVLHSSGSKEPSQSYSSPSPSLKRAALVDCHFSPHESPTLIHSHCSPCDDGPSVTDSHNSLGLKETALVDSHQSPSKEGPVSIVSYYSPSSECFIPVDSYNSGYSETASVDSPPSPSEEDSAQGNYPDFPSHEIDNQTDQYQSSSHKVCTVTDSHQLPTSNQLTSADSQDSAVPNTSPQSSLSSLGEEDDEVCSRHDHINPPKTTAQCYSLVNNFVGCVTEVDEDSNPYVRDEHGNDFDSFHHPRAQNKLPCHENGSDVLTDKRNSDGEPRAVPSDLPQECTASAPYSTNESMADRCFLAETPMSPVENCGTKSLETGNWPPKEIPLKLMNSVSLVHTRPTDASFNQIEERGFENADSSAGKKVNDISKGLLKPIRMCMTSTDLTSDDTAYEPPVVAHHSKYSSLNLYHGFTDASSCRGLMTGNFSHLEEDQAFPDPNQPNFDVSRIPLPGECEAIKAFFHYSRMRRKFEEFQKAQGGIPPDRTHVISEGQVELVVNKEHELAPEDSHPSSVPDQKVYQSLKTSTIISEPCQKNNQSPSDLDLNISDDIQFSVAPEEETLETLMDVVEEVCKCVESVDGGSTVHSCVDDVKLKENCECFENDECENFCSRLDDQDVQTMSDTHCDMENDCNLYSEDHAKNPETGESDLNRTCRPDSTPTESSIPVSREDKDNSPVIVTGLGLCSVDEIGASPKELHMETADSHSSLPVCEERDDSQYSNTICTGKDRAMSNHIFNTKILEKETSDLTLESSDFESEKETCESAREVSHSSSDWRKAFSNIHQAIGRSVLKSSQNWQSAEQSADVSPENMEASVCQSTNTEDFREIPIDLPITSSDSQCDEAESTEGRMMINDSPYESESVMVMEDRETVVANVSHLIAPGTECAEDDIPPLDAPGLERTLSSPDSDREMPCLEMESVQTPIIDEPLHARTVMMNSEVDPELSVEHRRCSSSEKSVHNPPDANMPFLSNEERKITSDSTSSNACDIVDTYNCVVLNRSISAPRKEMYPRNLNDESSESSDSERSSSEESCLDDNSSDGESDGSSSGSKSLIFEKRPSSELSKLKRRSFSTSGDTSSSSEDVDVPLSASTCQNALYSREWQIASQENVPEKVGNAEQTTEDSGSILAEVDESPLEQANCSANPGVSQLEISDIRTVVSTDSPCSTANSAFNLSGFLDSGWSFDMNSPLVTCSSEMLSVDSMYNWPYVEEEVFSRSNSTPVRDWSDLGGSGPFQVKCRLGWDRILSEGNGLILGPARIHVQVPGQPPQTEADLRWNIITRHRRQSSTCLEENNNMLPGPKSPIVIVKSIALKRPVATHMDHIHVESGVEQESSTPAQFIRTKGALKCFQNPCEPAESKRRKRSVDCGKPLLSTFDSDLACGEVPRVIIKRTGTGTCYKSFLQAAGLQPVVVLERNPRIEAMARQWMTQQRRKRSAELKMHAWKIREDKRNRCPLQVLAEEAENKQKEGIAQPPKNGQNSGTRNLLEVVEILSQWRREEEKKSTSEEVDCHNSNSELCSEADSKHFEMTFSEECLENSTVDLCNDNQVDSLSTGSSCEPSDNNGVTESHSSSWDESHSNTAECEAPVLNGFWKYDEGMPPQSPCMFITGEKVPTTSQEDTDSVHRCDVCGKEMMGYQERITHVKQHRYHCQECLLSFPLENNFMDHLAATHADLQERHHCLLCQLTFDSASRFTEHTQSWSHCQMELSQRQTIDTLFRMFTGSQCPNLNPDDSAPVDWCPKEPGAVHFYHEATPLQIAIQEWHARQERESQSTISKTHHL